MLKVAAAQELNSVNNKVLFLTSVSKDARIGRRINALKGLGIRPTVLSFEREGFFGDSKTDYISLGKLEHGNYAKRLTPFIRALPIIRQYAKDCSSIYCFGLDMLLLAHMIKPSLAGRVKLIYEVADIREVMFGDTAKAKVMRGFERFLVRRLDLLVLTSDAYYKHFYKGTLNLDVPYQLIENKLDHNALSVALEPSELRYQLGYFGLLRCSNTLAIIKNLAEQGKSVYMRGFARSPITDSDISEATKLEDITYGGPYDAPEDLPAMYGSVDMVWAAYPYEENRQEGNWRWARTNRFYEACYFGKPMITQKGTEDGRVVEALDIGLNLDLSDIEAASREVAAITPEKLERWQENIKALPKKVYMYTSEHEELAQFLSQA